MQAEPRVRMIVVFGAILCAVGGVQIALELLRLAGVFESDYNPIGVAGGIATMALGLIVLLLAGRRRR